MREVCLFVIIFLFLIGNVSAHFVCGVLDDSSDSMSSSWFDVHVYYENDSDNFASCKVSPADNKFCCDSEAISNHVWKVGDVIFASVVGKNLGYVSNEVSVVTSGEGYDVFPEMKLYKVIDIVEPKKRVFFGNDSIFFNISFFGDYSIKILKDEVGIFNCSPCDFFSDFVNVDFGMNYVNVFAKNNDEFFENFSFCVLDDVEVERDFFCEGCSSKVKDDSVVNMSLAINFSYYVEDFEIREFVPSSWIINDSAGGRVSSYDTYYNVITWNFEGDFFNKSYVVVSPNLGFFSQEDVFMLKLEDEMLSEDSIEVYNLLFAPSRSQERGSSKSWKKRGRVSFENAFVIGDNESFKAAIFSKNPLDDVLVRMFLGEENAQMSRRDLEFLRSYYFDSEISKENISRFMFEYNIDKDFLKENNFKGLEFFLNKFGEIIPITGKVIALDDGNETKYTLDNEEFGNVLIYGVKDELSFWDRVMSFFDWIFRRK